MKKQPAPKNEPGNPPLLLRLPREVGQPLMEESNAADCTCQALILKILAERYEIDDFIPPIRGSVKRVKTGK